MNPSDTKIRFDELCAGRALGDLTHAEERELVQLCEQVGLAPDASLDLLAAALHADALQDSPESLPAHLSQRLHEWAEQSAESHETKIVRPQFSAWRVVASHPLPGWLAAAAILIFGLILNRENSPLPPAKAEIRLRTEASDLVEWAFEGLGEFKQAAGSVIWSDQLQKGFMRLEGIPVNNPTQAQYQLWIVDPARDADSPVDGGVFDFPSAGSPVVIPINAKLALKKPQAFVITLEQPGGVVKSKQEKVVALAKN